MSQRKYLHNLPQIFMYIFQIYNINKLRIYFTNNTICKYQILFVNVIYNYLKN